MAKENPIIWAKKREEPEEFDSTKVGEFIPFLHGAVVFGGHFGDEGKGKIVDYLARKYKEKGLKLLSVRGQGSGNAGHTVVDAETGIKYDFHYLTSAGLWADIMLLGAGMLLDPIRVLEETKKLPKSKQDIVLIDERATISSVLDRAMDEWLENQRASSGKPIIGTTKSGVGPCVAWRAQREHITFADALKCETPDELYKLFRGIQNVPKEVQNVFSEEYARELFEAIRNSNIVNSQILIENCRSEENWAVLLEVSQAMSLDSLFGNSGHFVTSTHCSDIGAAADAGLTMYDFYDQSYIVLKAYASKVGSGPFITKFTEDEISIDDFIHDMVGECGVTTGRKRDLGWFDGPAVRMAIQRTGTDKLCINCMDVIGKIPGGVSKICYAYKHKETGKVCYYVPYHMADYKPLYIEVPTKWEISGATSIQELPGEVHQYIHTIEQVTGGNVKFIGTGSSSKDLIKF